MKKLVVAMTLAAFAMPFAKAKPVADSVASKKAAVGEVSKKKVKKSKKKKAVAKKADSVKADTAKAK